MNTFPGTQDEYFAMVRYENDVARVEAARRERALNDPTLQCEHHVSLYRGCESCTDNILAIEADKLARLKAVGHVDYPHMPGWLHDCEACETGPCQCTPTSAECLSHVHGKS